MRLKLASWLCLVLSFGVARAQTPGRFAPDSQLGSTQLNAAFGAKADAANPVITGTLTLGGPLTGTSGAFSGALSGSTLSVGGTGPITGLGYGVGNGMTWGNFQGSGIPAIITSGRMAISKAQGTEAAGDFSTVEIWRQTAFSGGAGQFNNALRVGMNIGANDASQEWAIGAVVNTLGHAGGTAIGGFFNTVRGVGSTDFIWGSISDAVDNTNLGSAASGASGIAAVELDVEGNGPDDGANGSEWGGLGRRIIASMSAIRHIVSNTTQTELANGIRFSTTIGGGVNSGPDVHTNYQSAIGFAVNTQIRQALDTRGAITPAGSSNPVSAVTMAAGHVIDFNGGASLTSAPGNYLWWDSGSSRWKYTIAGVDKFSVDASGNARFAGTVTASVTP